MARKEQESEATAARLFEGGLFLVIRPGGKPNSKDIGWRHDKDRMGYWSQVSEQARGWGIAGGNYNGTTPFVRPVDITIDEVDRLRRLQELIDWRGRLGDMLSDPARDSPEWENQVIRELRQHVEDAVFAMDDERNQCVLRLIKAVTFISGK